MVVVRLTIYVALAFFMVLACVVPSLADSEIVYLDQGHPDSLFVVRADGTVWSCGQNFGGILGDGTQNDRCVLGPTFVDNVRKLSVGVCGVVLKTDGTVWTWGINRYSVRGYQTSDNLSFAPVPNFTDVRDVFSSHCNVFAIKNDGSVWAWGFNMFGALGDGTTETRGSPVQVMGLPGDIVTIEPAGIFTLALDGEGRVWAWGDNRFGELGDGTTMGSLTPKLVPIDHVKKIETGKVSSTAYVLKDDGTVWAWGDNTVGEIGNGVANPGFNNLIEKSPVMVNGLTNIIDVSSGGSSVMALKSDGTVWAWGENYELLGDGTQGRSDALVSPKRIEISDVVAISCGNGYYAFKRDGSLWGWGYNHHGDLGVGWFGDVCVPTRVLTEPGATPIPGAGSTPLPYVPTIMPTPTPVPSPSPSPSATPANVTMRPTQTTLPTVGPTVTVSPGGTVTPEPASTLTGTPVPSQSSGFDFAAVLALIGLVLVSSFLLSARGRK